LDNRWFWRKFAPTIRERHGDGAPWLQARAEARGYGGHEKVMDNPLTSILCRPGTTSGFSSDSIPPGGERRDLMEIGDEVTILP